MSDTRHLHLGIGIGSDRYEAIPINPEFLPRLYETKIIYDCGEADEEGNGGHDLHIDPDGDHWSLDGIEALALAIHGSCPRAAIAKVEALDTFEPIGEVAERVVENTAARMLSQSECDAIAMKHTVGKSNGEFIDGAMSALTEMNQVNAARLQHPAACQCDHCRINAGA